MFSCLTCARENAFSLGFPGVFRTPLKYQYDLLTPAFLSDPWKYLKNVIFPYSFYKSTPFGRSLPV